MHMYTESLESFVRDTQPTSPHFTDQIYYTDKNQAQYALIHEAIILARLLDDKNQSESSDCVGPPTHQQPVCAQQEGTGAAFLWHRMFFLCSKHPPPPDSIMPSDLCQGGDRNCVGKGAILKWDNVTPQAFAKRLMSGQEGNHEFLTSNLSESRVFKLQHHRMQGLRGGKMQQSCSEKLKKNQLLGKHKTSHCSSQSHRPVIRTAYSTVLIIILICF